MALFRILLLSFFYSTVVYPIQTYAGTLALIDFKIAQSASFFGELDAIESEEDYLEPFLEESIKQEEESPVYTVSNTEQTSLANEEETSVFAQIYEADLEYGIIGSQYGESDDPLDNFFDILIQEPIDFRKSYYLEYVVKGVNSLSSLARSINGNPALGNNLVRYSQEEEVIKERINPILLKKGNNRIFFNVNNSSGVETFVSQVKILQEEGNSKLETLVLTDVQQTTEGGLYLRGFVASNQPATLRYKMNAIPLDGKKEFETILDFNPKEMSYLVYQDAETGLQQIDLTPWLKKTTLLSQVQHEVTLPNKSERFPIIHHQENHIEVSGAAIQFPEEAIGSAITEIQVEKLRKIDLAPQGAGIVNITKDQQGYRFLPDGSTFEKEGLISIEFDENLVPNETKHEDIHIFYFDESSKKWVAISKDQVIAEQNKVSGFTDHFTDYIAGVIQMPESPDYSGFTPTGARNLPAAKPTDKINFVEMPEVSNTGDANVSYPIEIPAGRKGMQPNLSLSYSSGSSSSGWVGLGWDLNVPSIEVNTTWGAAIYDPSQESELYSMGGEDIVLLNNGVEYAPNLDNRIGRVANATFAPRIEGSFSKIERLGSSPSTYSWVVTTKAGVKYYYGSVAQARLTTGSGTQGNIAKWMLNKMEDLNGNYVEYEYELKNFSAGSLAGGKQVYLKTILYTKHANNSANNGYKVVFNRTNSVAGSAREDKTFSVRRGVKEVEDDLLSEIVINKVQSGNETQIRKYVLGYKKGAFGKTLLNKVTQMYNNITFHTHEFEYHNEIASGGIFAPRARVQSYTDFSGVFNKLKVSASAIGGGKGEYKGINAGIYGGFASIFKPTTLLFISRAGTLGVTGFSSSSKSESIIALMDIDGDGLPDKVFKSGDFLYYRKNLGGHFSGLKSPILGRSNFSKSKTKTLGAGLEVNLIAHASGTKSWSETKIPTYLEDVNNDGLVDIVDNGDVYFNSLSNRDRIPFFHKNSSRSSNPIFTSGAISVSPPPQLPSPKIPTADIVKMWEAPFNGTVNITGTIISTGSTAYYSIEKGKATQTSDTSFLKNIVSVPRTNTATTVNAIAVQKGDRIFFRVISGSSGANIAVEWDPKVTYTTAADASYVDSNGFKPYDNPFSQGYVISGFTPIEIKENGTYSIQADAFVLDNRVNVANAPLLSDEVLLVIKRFKLNTTNTASTNLYLPIHAGALVDVYKQRIKLSELNTIPALNYPFTVSNIISGDENSFQYIKAEIQSTSNVNWQKISSLWNPRITDSEGYLNKVLTPEITIYNKEYRKQNLALTLSGPSTFKISHSISVSGCNGDCAQGYVYFTAKNGKGEVFKESSTSSQYVKYRFKYDGGALKNFSKFNNNTGNYDVVGGTSTETTFELSSTSNSLANKVYFEWHSENPLVAEKLVGNVNQAVLKVTTVLGGSGAPTVTTNPVPANVFAKLGNNQFGPMYQNWGFFGYKSKQEVNNRTEPINQKVISNEGVQQGVNQDSSDLSESEFRECEEKETYEEYMACVEEKRNRNGTPTPETPPRLYVLYPNKELEKWQLNSRMFITSLLSSPYLERLEDEEEHDNDDDDRHSRDRGVDGLGEGSESSHSAKGVIKYMTSVSKGFTAGAIVVSYSENKVTGKAINDFRDINGDGYPDILGDRIQLTNEKGGLTQRIIDKKVLQNFDAKGTGGGVSIASGTLLGFIQSVKGKTVSPTTAVKSSGSAAGLGINSSYFTTDDFVSSDLVDLNGDGLPDYLEKGGRVALNYGSEFRADNSWGIADVKVSETKTYSGGGGVNLFNGSIAGGFSISKNISEDVISLLDINGDGLPDKIVGKNTVYLNTGTGFSSQAIYLPVSSSKENQNISGGINANVTYCIYFLVPLVFTGPKVCFSLGGDIGKSLSKETVQIMDFDGDGYPDILVSDSEGDLQVAYSRIGKTNLLKTIKRPLGGVIEIDYSNKNPKESKKIGLNYAMPFTKWVMTKASIYDGYAGDGENTMRRSYSYYKGFKDRRERKFLGFGEIVTNELDRAGEVFRSVKDEYLVNGVTESEAYGPGLNPMVRQYYFKKGLLEKQTMYDKHGRIYSKVQNAYQFYRVSANNQSDYTIGSSQISFSEKERYLPLLSSVITSKYEFNETETTGQEYQTRVYFDRYDRYGNVLKYRDVGDSHTLNAADLITVNMTYHYNTANHLVAIPKTHEVIFQGQNRKVESEIDAKGNMIGFKKFLSPTQSVKYQFSYDGFGNLTQKKHPVINGTQYEETISYETIFNLYPNKILNNRGGGALLAYVYGWDVLSYVKVNGLEAVSYSYDSFGRMNLISANQINAKYLLQNIYNLQYNPQQNLYPYVLTEKSAVMVDAQSSSYSDVYYQSSLFTDGLGRVIQVKQQLDKDESCPGVTTGYRLAVSGATLYDEFGRSIKTSLPSEEVNCSQSLVSGLTRFSTPIMDADNSMEMMYDNVDRPISEFVNGINALTKYTYGFGQDCSGVKRFKKEVTLPEGNKSISYFDAKGRKTAVQQIGDNQTLCTIFNYNALGDVVNVTDAEGKLTSYIYNTIGQLKEKNQVDKGQVKYTYDDIGQVLTLETNNLRQASETIAYSYVKEQLVKEKYPNNTVDYSYNNDLLTEVKDNVIQDHFTYSYYGDISKQKRTVQTPDGYSYSSEVSFVYDFWGRIGSITYPDAEKVIYHYDQGGMLKRIVNNTNFDYVKSITYDHYGNRKKIKYGNDVETEYFYSHQNRLRGLTLRRPTNELFMNLLMTYDHNSNVTSIKNASSLHATLDIGGLSEQNYSYDGFNRLQAAATKWEGKREKHSSSLGMKYNKTHGISSKYQNHNVFNIYTSVSENTENQYTADYKYDASKHQVASITYNGVGQQGLSYLQHLKYDANGNISKTTKVERASNRTVDDRSLYWDAKDQLQAVVVGNQVSYYNYDYTGNRVVKSLGQSQSFAINGLFNSRLSVVDNYILYPNQYITVEKSGNYTKHYYSGTEKIASSIGAGISFGSGNSTYRTQFESGLRGLFADSNYDEPQFFTPTNRASNCEETLYYLKQMYEQDGSSECARRFNELLHGEPDPCVIVEKMEFAGCIENCDKELESIIEGFYKEKNEKCLAIIKNQDGKGYTSCQIIDILYKEGCLDEKCLDEYNSWISFLEEHKRFDCLEKLLAYVKKSGMDMCEAVAYMEKNSDCFDIEVVENCYKEFLSAYENCLLLYSEELEIIYSGGDTSVYREPEYDCIWYIIKFPVDSTEIDYCELLKYMKVPPKKPNPPVVLPEIPTPGEVTEVDPVVPELPVIPERPYRQGKIWWYHSDHLGSSSYLTDINGIPTHYYGYLPFGELMVEHNNSNYDNVYKFNGKELDPQTGYYYYGARYYDPTMSIFLSVDPLAESQPNKMPYHYVSNNPINRIDPTGMLDHDYKINDDGTFTKVKDTNTPDRVFNSQGGFVDLEYNGQIDDMKKYGDSSVLKVSDGSKSNEIFEFFAKNSEVEWGQVKTDQSSYVLTDHDSFSVNGSGFAYSLLNKGENVTDINHSHPIHYIGAETPSGYGYNGTIDNSYSKPNPYSEPMGDYKSMKNLINGFKIGDKDYKGYGDKARKINFRVFNTVKNSYIKYDENSAVKE
ncbi:SpvB/TcaC N-terminal domain-containing protein [Myroides odoratus]|uniref:SpvB/TcaC N-terminal domain-containing protein n=1 Tax=Myroides odoratus TaxID=256 RepID=UPI0018D249BE|nr:SpvB/TcaC N-terminal domain-containing protein [Myroides odoratus]